MRSSYLCLLTALLCFNAAAQSVLIKNVTVVSGHLSVPLTHANVLIEQGRIRRISQQPINLSDNTVQINAQGQYLVPGIFDGHVHVSSVPGMGFGVEPITQQHQKLANEYYAQQPASFLYYGVTQVLDPNPGNSWQKFTGAGLHPDYFRCEVITSVNTFPFVEKTNDQSKSMFHYLVNEQARAGEANSAEVLVEQIKQSGALCIKLYFEDGYGNDSQWPLLSDATLKRIRIAADKAGLAILGHANALDMYQAAIKAGVDVMAHGMWNWGPYMREKTLPQQIKSELDTLMLNNIQVMPTQMIISGLGEVMLTNAADNPDFNAITPTALIDWYHSDEAQWFKQELRVGFDHLEDDVIARIFLNKVNGRVGKGAQVMAYLKQHNYPVLLGSDFPGSPSFANQPGLTSIREMEKMAEAGYTPMDILKAATINNARQFKLDKDYGTVESGKVANLLLLHSNPQSNVSAWRDIDVVILKGKVIKRETFRADKAIH